MTDAGEIIKSGAFDKLADIIHKLAGPMAEEVGQMMGDRMKLYALKNWIDVVKRGQQILADAPFLPEFPDVQCPHGGGI